MPVDIQSLIAGALISLFGSAVGGFITYLSTARIEKQRYQRERRALLYEKQREALESIMDSWTPYTMIPLQIALELLPYKGSTIPEDVLISCRTKLSQVKQSPPAKNLPLLPSEAQRVIQQWPKLLKEALSFAIALESKDADEAHAAADRMYREFADAILSLSRISRRTLVAEEVIDEGEIDSESKGPSETNHGDGSNRQ